MRPLTLACAAALAAVLLFPSAPAPAVEPGEGEPGVFKILHEDDAVRILEAKSAPGQTEGWHSHPRYFAYVISGGKMRYDFPDGSTREVEIPTGTNRMIDPVAKHRGTNIGDTTFHVILVEFKK